MNVKGEQLKNTKAILSHWSSCDLLIAKCNEGRGGVEEVFFVHFRETFVAIFWPFSLPLLFGLSFTFQVCRMKAQKITERKKLLYA